MLKNKKGWLRIFEAFLAIAIITGVFVFLYSSQKSKSDFDESIKNMMRSVLWEIIQNDGLRSSILNNEVQPCIEFASYRIPSYLDYTMRICNLTEICGYNLEYRENVYADETIISSNLSRYEPKKLKIFVWEK